MSYSTVRRYLQWRLRRGVLFGRLEILPYRPRRIQWLGSLHTFTLYPHYKKRDRDNL